MPQAAGVAALTARGVFFMSASIQGATAAGFAQLQRMQAERTAAQAEARADALADAAAEARREADAAVKRADDVEIDFERARSTADTLRQAVSTAQGFDELPAQISERIERLAAAVSREENAAAEVYGPAAEVATPAAPRPGALVDVRA
ncbi:hypothetical protein [Pseudothauera lacus]|uniref:Uncharacterized protein n=1 Tax=Pseudothauera lacus TaxID=2136175 RepID=A0A2T4ICN3_9RHOO|nr:hypothetical protein [Pseudothauera lacus]PTD95486.1 hypothetical protein C8261_13575 [Pseudothauera lacus]